MSKDGRDHWAHMEKVLEDTRRYSRELLVEHEKLRARSLVLETQQARLEEELQAARHDLLRERAERDELRAALSAVEKESTAFAERSVAVEQRNSQLTLLCGASYRLFHGTLERPEVLARIREVVADVVGSEEMAVFTLVPERAALRLEQAFGTSAAFPDIPLGSGLIGRSVQEGETWVAGRSADAALPYEKELQACVPLLVEGRPVGALAIFRLLPQKPRLQGHDLDTFELLATHAAAALYCAALRARDPIAS